MENKVAIFEDNRTLRDSLKHLIDNGKDDLHAAHLPIDQTGPNMQVANLDVVMMDINIARISGIEAVQDV